MDQGRWKMKRCRGATTVVQGLTCTMHNNRTSFNVDAAATNFSYLINRQRNIGIV